MNIAFIFLGKCRSSKDWPFNISSCGAYIHPIANQNLILKWKKKPLVFPFHYWLRGKWIKKGAKKCKSRPLFLIQKTHQVIFAVLLELVMTHILYRKKWMTLVQKICPKLQQIYKKVEDGLVRCWSFVGWKYWPCREKKLKIAMLNEASFMVKLKF